MTCAMLLSANITSAFWAEALTVAVYINNHSSTKANDSHTPFELWTENKPHLSHLHPFSCSIYLLKLPYQHSKLTSKSNKGLYLGPAGDTSHHHIWVKASCTVTTSCNVIFIKPVAQLHLYPNEPSDTALPVQPVQVNQSLNNTHLLGLDDTFSEAETTTVQHFHSLPVLPLTAGLVPPSPHLSGMAPVMNTPDSSPSVSPIPSLCQSPSLSPICLSNISVVSIYVDDCLIISRCLQVNEIKASLAKKFKIKDLGPVNSILGIEVLHDCEKRTTCLHQSSHIDSLLAKFNMVDVKPVTMPLQPGLSLAKINKTPRDCYTIPY